MYSKLICLLICLTFYTFQLPAQVVTKPNQVGINTNDPAANVSLHIRDEFEAIRLDGANPFLSFYNGTDYRGYLYMAGNNMYLYNRKAGSLFFGTSNVSRMLLDSDGNMGLGTSSPKTRLHVTQGTLSGGLFNANTIAGFEKAVGNGFISILTNDAYESGLLFGDQLVAERGGIIYNNGSTPDGLQFRTNGNVTRMALDSQGDLGIGRSNPLRPIHIKSRNGGDEYGILVERSGSSVSWEMSVFGGNFNWFYNGSSTPTSRIETDGTYNSSDRRLKKNIKAYKSVLPLLDQLHISTYEMLNSSKRGQSSLGLIAQDVVKVFPEIVRYTPNREGEMYYSMDYSKTGVIALKAIQELQQQQEEEDNLNEVLRSEVEALRSENRQLKDRLLAVEAAIAQFEKNCCTTSQRILLDQPREFNKSHPLLEQNEPNPFSHTTTIRYFIPEDTRQAVLRVMTMDGKILKDTSIDARGKGELILETDSLRAGTYIYSLLIDGEVYESRQMVLGSRR